MEGNSEHNSGELIFLLKMHNPYCGGKMKIVKYLLFLSVIGLIGCDNPTSSNGGTGTIVGNWVMIQEVYTEDGMSDTYNYDPSQDNYFEAMILAILPNNKLITNANDAGTDWYSDTVAYQISGNQFTMDYVDVFTYSISNGKLILSQNLDGEISTIKFARYSGPIPPASWLTAISNDSYEPDNSSSTASSIIVGSSATQHIITEDDSDWFKFNAAAGKSYLILVTGIMDNVLTLYDTDGSSFIYEDDDNDNDVPLSGNVESVIVFECFTAGTYYFKVSGYSSSEEGTYQISVSETTLESTAYALAKKTTGKSKFHHSTWLRMSGK